MVKFHATSYTRYRRSDMSLSARCHKRRGFIKSHHKRGFFKAMYNKIDSGISFTRYRYRNNYLVTTAKIKTRLIPKNMHIVSLSNLKRFAKMYDNNYHCVSELFRRKRKNFTMF